MLDNVPTSSVPYTTTVPIVSSPSDPPKNSNIQSISDSEQNTKFSSQTYSWENAYLTLAKKLNIFYFVGVEMTVDLLDTSKTIIKVSPRRARQIFT